MQKNLKSNFALATAFVTCPCHLLIIIPIFAGTVFGAFLSENVYVIAIILSIIFILSLAIFLKFQVKNKVNYKWYVASNNKNK